VTKEDVASVALDGQDANRTQERARPRPAVAALHSSVALLLVAVISAVAFAPRNESPPSIAEFAPRALEQITEAPAEQSSSAGSGAGGEGVGDSAAAAPTTTALPAVEVDPEAPPATHRCVGKPARQTEDPQSPPCVPFWEGDNGGRTHAGVTKDEVRIAVSSDETKSWAGDTFMHDLVAYFNHRFEFYGRKLRLVEVASSGSSPEQQTATARAAKQLDVFAALGTLWGFPYSMELANQGIVNVANAPQFTEALLREHSPFLWQYEMSVDRQLAYMGDWMCSRFAGRPARFAGISDTTDMSAARRKFGLILIGDPVLQLSPEPLEKALKGCGEGVLTIVNPGDQTQAIIQLQEAGVTTIACFCHGSVDVRGLGQAATSQRYFPEWLVTTYLLNDLNWWHHNTGFYPDQRQRVMGLTMKPRQIAVANEFAERAILEMNPRNSSAGEATVNNLRFLRYREMLLLASGIQLAGPRLTPETFAEGLQGATFPNPESPYHRGHVGFQRNSHAMTLDAAEFYWSDNGRSPYTNEPRGSLCYVDAGQRRRLGAMPAGDEPFFSPRCDSGA
jgi:hypothetical protein